MRSLFAVTATRLFLAFFILFSFSAPKVEAANTSAGASTGASTGPALWKIDTKDAKGEVYLFGSVHMLKKGVAWMSPAIKAAFAHADELILEADLDKSKQAEMQAIVVRKGVYPGDDNLQKHIAPDLFRSATEMAKGAGIPAATFVRLRPWYAATVLGVGYVQAQGYDVAEGVETRLRAEAVARKLKITGLETVEEQMSALADNPEKVQEAMLRDTVEQLQDVEKMLKNLTAAWVSGDTDTLGNFLVSPMRKVPALYQSLVVRRNQNWMPKIQTLLSEPGVHFVVVGTAHLIGSDGLVAMLRDQKIHVIRQ